MAGLTENQIIDNTFYMLEKDSTPWGTSDAEYTTARGLLNMAIQRWEHYENTTWRELWTTLIDASDGDKTTTADDFTYDCPTNFVRPGGYVTTSLSGIVTFWKVIPVEEASKYKAHAGNVCWFTGSYSSNFVLNFNSNATVAASSTIDFPYYKSATISSATSTVLEPGDPNFLSYFISAHMSESTESVEADFFTISEGLLKQMRSRNNSGVWAVPSNIEPSLADYDGFGTGGNYIATSSNPTGR